MPLWPKPFSLLLLAAAFALPASAAPLAKSIEVDASTAIFFFSGDHEKVEKASTETAGDLVFRVEREPRAIARDLAREELQKGNVCLTQVASDLKTALKRNQIPRLCRSIFQDDVEDAAREMRRVYLEADYLRCEAQVDAREEGGSLRLLLTFRGQLVSRGAAPVKLRRAGFAPEPKGWALPARDTVLGEAAPDWKGVLKNGSCTLDEKTLAGHLAGYLAQAKEARALARCRSRYSAEVESHARLQRQLQDYVPDEWLKRELDAEEREELLRPAAPAESFAGVKDCNEGGRQLAEQLKRLRRVSEKVADRHDVPALDPSKRPGRAPASWSF